MKYNPRIFLEFQFGCRKVGVVVIELFADVVPRSAENFIGLCTGEYGKGRQSKMPLCYLGCKVFKIYPGQYIQCGDIVSNNGQGGESIYGGLFPSENHSLWHSHAGIVSLVGDMENPQTQGTCGSQFIITLNKLPALNRRNVVVGQVRFGMEIIRAMEKIPLDVDEVPRIPILISGCNRFTGSVKLLRREVDESQPANKRGLELLNMCIADREFEAPASSVLAAAQPSIKGETAQSESASSDDASESDSADVEEERDESDNAAEDAEGDSESDDGIDAVLKAQWIELRSLMADEEEGEDVAAIEANIKGNRREMEYEHASRSFDVAVKSQSGLEAEAARERRARKAERAQSSFSLWNEQSVYKSYDKLASKVRRLPRTYDHSGSPVPDADGVGVVAHEAPTTGGVSMLAPKRKSQRKKGPKDAGGDVSYINRRNQVFNKQLEKAYGPYVVEMRQNLERGTAL